MLSFSSVDNEWNINYLLVLQFHFNVPQNGEQIANKSQKYKHFVTFPHIVTLTPSLTDRCKYYVTSDSTTGYRDITIDTFTIATGRWYLPFSVNDR